MITKYVIDACALISFLYDEQGADKVQKVKKRPGCSTPR